VHSACQKALGVAREPAKELPQWQFSASFTQLLVSHIQPVSSGYALSFGVYPTFVDPAEH
jgi:hypothetical protein